MLHRQPLPPSTTTLSWLHPNTREFWASLPGLSESQQTQELRLWYRHNLWDLMVMGLGRTDLVHPWLYQRCLEVQASPDGHLDLWARAHYKSTIITFGKTIQDILASHGDDPLAEWGGTEPTFCIFSHTRPIAKAFLRQIKTELARNEHLKTLYPDILYEAPDRQAPRWSEDAGIVVRRKTNPKESTVEAWGLVDGQPTSKHFQVLIYDDVVVPGSVTTPDMIRKTTEAWELSHNLGDAQPRQRVIGTRYHFADTYRAMMEREAVKVRKHTATHNDQLTGDPVLLTRAQLEDKIRKMGPYTASAQLFQNPIADSKQTFAREWFDERCEPNEVDWSNMSRALICDPASGKKGTDFTAMAVIGKGPDRKVYVLDMVRDRLNLKQRAETFLRLHKRWRPQHAAYEEYGLQADIDYIREVQNRKTYRFEVIPLKGKLSKEDRINRLIPLAANLDLLLPDALHRTNAEGKLEELTSILIEQEFLAWPVPAHDDMMDALARMFDLEDFDFPLSEEPDPDDRYNKPRGRRGSWMSM
jgi:predicted phage terminase large subunit-like protein